MSSRSGTIILKGLPESLAAKRYLDLLCEEADVHCVSTALIRDDSPIQLTGQTLAYLNFTGKSQAVAALPKIMRALHIMRTERSNPFFDHAVAFIKEGDMKPTQWGQVIVFPVWVGNTQGFNPGVLIAFFEQMGKLSEFAKSGMPKLRCMDACAIVNFADFEGAQRCLSKCHILEPLFKACPYGNTKFLVQMEISILYNMSCSVSFLEAEVIILFRTSHVYIFDSARA